MDRWIGFARCTVRDGGSLTPRHLIDQEAPYPTLTLPLTLPLPLPLPLTLPLTRKLSACVALVAEHPNVVAYLAQRPATPL